MEVTFKPGLLSRRAAAAGAAVAAETTGEIVLARGIHKTYDTGAVKTHALRGVDLSVERGEMVAIMGPSGCGKTTLLNCLAGLEEFEQGAIYIDGSPLKGMSDNKKTEYRAREMGFVFQSYNLLPVLSAVENVELPLRVSGTDLKESKARAEMWLARLGLGDRMYNRTFELSAGQQQRVAVARALIGEPEVVLADEPIAEVDTENADLILEALWEVIRRGGAVLAATHNPEVLRYSSRVILFRDGKVEAEGRPEEISARLTVD
jgi:putative ABC transport system ATP-binding protein